MGTTTVVHAVLVGGAPPVGPPSVPVPQCLPAWAEARSPAREVIWRSLILAERALPGGSSEREGLGSLAMCLSWTCILALTLDSVTKVRVGGNQRCACVQ